MKKITLFLLILFIFFEITIANLYGLQITPCYIKDPAKHEFNKKLLQSVVNQELSNLPLKTTSLEQADYLSHRITKIADALLKNGFYAEAYEVPVISRDMIVSYYCFALWEGEHVKESIPLTFFVYVWPSEEYALRYNDSPSTPCYYRSIIHSHPIPCAFAVLQGTLFQKDYERVPSLSNDRVVRLIDEEVFQPGCGDVDDLKKPFIHQLYSKGSGSKACLSLHAYGLPTEEKVMKCFRETRSTCNYKHLLKANGVVEVLP